MLKDRGYEIGTAELEETYEEFEAKDLVKRQLNLIAKRPVQTSSFEEGGMEADQVMMEPIYVVFTTDKDTVNKDTINKIVVFMDKYSTENQNANTQPLTTAIVIVKGGTTPIAKKVRFLDSQFAECPGDAPLRDRALYVGRAACQHHLPRTGAQARRAPRQQEARAPQALQSQGEPAAQDPVRGPHCALLRRASRASDEDRSALGDSRPVRDLQTGGVIINLLKLLRL